MEKVINILNYLQDKNKWFFSIFKCDQILEIMCHDHHVTIFSYLDFWCLIQYTYPTTDKCRLRTSNTFIRYTHAVNSHCVRVMINWASAISTLIFKHKLCFSRNWYVLSLYIHTTTPNQRVCIYLLTETRVRKPLHCSCLLVRVAYPRGRRGVVVRSFRHE